MVMGIVACSGFGTKSEPDYTRGSPAYGNIERLHAQLKASGTYDQALFDKTLADLQAAKDPLGQGDLYWLRGMSHFLDMRADNSDTFNFRAARESFNAAKDFYLEIDEEWLAAKATFGLAFSSVRASRHWDACQEYDLTIELLDSGDGFYKDFEYDRQAFSNPQEYVNGVFKEDCTNLRADPGRHNFDENGNVRILKRTPAKAPQS